MKQRVVFNTWAGAFFQPGGGEVQVLESRSALQEMGYDVQFYNQWKPQTDIDIFHQFSIEEGGIYPMLAYKRLGVKVALSTIYWGEIIESNPHFHRIKSLVDCADILFTNSDMESSQMERIFDVPPEKFHKTRNSIPSTYLSNANPLLFPQRFGLNGDFCLVVANVDRRKNLHLVVDACKEIGIPLVTIGHIKDSEYFESFCSSYELHKHLGPINDTELLASAYASCRLFVLASHCETPGIAALEALSQGAQVVITQEGSTREYFKSYADYVDPQDYISIREVIKSALKVDRKEEDKEQARHLMREKYSWSQTALDIDSGYRKIL